MNSVYDDPEKYGLEMIDEVNDANADYSFDMVVVWRDVNTGIYFYDRDSGCSCPSPFEDQGRDTLIPLNIHTWKDFLAEMDSCGASLDDRLSTQKELEDLGVHTRWG